MKFKRNSVLALAVLFSMGVKQVSAQLYPMGTVYYQNQYLGNPALAGVQGGLNFNGAYRTQWNSIPGAPTVQTFTAEYAITEKAGFGINVYNDKAGLFKRTRTVATYAYHLPINASDDRLHFGLSLGFLNEQISNEDINGDGDDLVLRGFNDRETYIDGDFGIAYTGKRLSIQAALPNLNNILSREELENAVDKSTFFAATSYKITISPGAAGFNLEPKLVFRGIQGYDNIVDAGANLSYAENKINLFAMYHTSQNSSFGLGLNYLNMSINGIYTTPTRGLRGYTAGDFAIHLSFKILDRK